MVIAPLSVVITAYSSGPTRVTSGDTGAGASRRSARASMSNGVPANCANGLPLGTTNSTYVPGLAACAQTVLRSTLFSPVNSTGALPGNCLPEKSVNTSRLSPSAFTVTVRGSEGGYQVRDGVIEVINASK